MNPDNTFFSVEYCNFVIRANLLCKTPVFYRVVKDKQWLSCEAQCSLDQFILAVNKFISTYDCKTDNIHKFTDDLQAYLRAIPK